MNGLISLPQPDEAARAHSQQLIATIQAEIIQAGGQITFARYMELALYTPGLGYYSAGARKFGKQGDFVTASEISPLFAKCLAQQFKQILTTLSQGEILELGAGSGIFAKDVMLEMEKLNCLPKQYLILEVSAELRLRQQQLFASHCPHLLSKVQWIDTPPKELTGIIFANEVLDALPTHCFRIDNDSFQEKYVSFVNDAFTWQLASPTHELALQLALLLDEHPLAHPYESEMNLMAPALIKTLAESLHQGVMLFFDYGYGRREYYHPQRSMGTLMCYYQHLRHANPLILTGLQDITAHIDFTSIIESGFSSGLTLSGYTTQAAFLLACGLTDLAQNYPSAAIKTLLLPAEMGELIKVIGLNKNYPAALQGFSLLDRQRDL